MDRILGIDPGSKYTGWGIIQSDGEIFEYVDSGVINTTKIQSLPERLEYVYDNLSKILAIHSPTLAAIEDTFAHKFFKASLVLAQAQAVAILACTKHGLSTEMIQSKTVKKILTGNGNAEKEFVNTNLKLMIQNIEFTTNDASDALAIALAHSIKRRSQSLYECA